MSGHILALDIATSCGWAHVTPRGGVIVSGTWDLSEYRDVGDRVASLHARVVHATMGFNTIVAYEVLRFGGNADAAHHWGALWGAVRHAISERRGAFIEVAPAAWKRTAGLRAASGPEAALAAARTRWHSDAITTEDEAVARWVGVTAARKLLEEKR